MKNARPGAAVAPVERAVGLQLYVEGGGVASRECAVTGGGLCLPLWNEARGCHSSSSKEGNCRGRQPIKK